MRLINRPGARLGGAVAAALIAVPLAVVAAAAPAAADTWPFSSYFRPDKGLHNYCYSVTGTTAAVRTQVYNAMVYMHNNTRADRAYHANCDLSGSGQTDVVWREANADNGAIGSARCVVFHAGVSPRRCDRYFVMLSGPRIRAHYSRAAYERNQYRKTACHELGHTLGLNHYAAPYNSSCQRSGWTGTSSATWTRTWTSHHRGHINNWFG